VRVPAAVDRQRWTITVTNILIVLIVLVWLFPVYWIVMTSLKTRSDIINDTPIFFFKPTLDNYRTIFGPTYQFAVIVQHSYVIATLTTLVVMLLAIPAAYSLARFRTNAARRLALWILSLRMLPPIAAVIPYYVLATKAGKLDTYFAMVVVYGAFGLPLAIWLLRGFFTDVPQELDQAARLDGYGYMGVLRRIILPLGAPSIAVTAILTFVFTWNEFLLALLLTDTRAVTVPVQISKMILAYQVLWGELSAAGVIALIPLVVVVFALQRYIVRGLTLGAVK
jgi:multiple sugar transport system permease protein